MRWSSTRSPSPEVQRRPILCAHNFPLLSHLSPSSGSTSWTSHLTLREWDLYLVKRKTLSSSDTSLSRSYFSNCRDSCWGRCKVTHRKRDQLAEKTHSSFTSSQSARAADLVKWDRIISEHDKNAPSVRKAPVVAHITFTAIGEKTFDYFF